MGKLSHLIFFIAWKCKHFLTPEWFDSEVTFAAAKPHGWLHIAVRSGEMMHMEALVVAALIALSCSAVHVLCISLCAWARGLLGRKKKEWLKDVHQAEKGFDNSLLLFRRRLPRKLNGSELVFSLSEMKPGYGRSLRSLLSSTGFITCPWKWIYVYWSFEYLLA